MFSEVAFNTMPWGYAIIAALSLWFCCNIKRSVMVFLLTVVGLITYGELVVSYLVHDRFRLFDLGVEHVFFTCAIQLALFSLGALLQNDKFREHIYDYGIVLRLWAMRFGLLTLFIFTFEGPMKGLIRATLESGAEVFGPAILVLAAQALFIALAARNPDRYYELKSDLLIMLGFVGACLAVSLAPGYQNVEPFQIGINLLLIGAGVWLVKRGIELVKNSYVYLGTFVLLVLAFTRYFDLIGDYIGASILFMIEALIMFVVARYLRNRQSNRMEVLDAAV